MQTVRGRALADGPMAQAQVQFLRADGTVLATVSTDAAGQFQANLPEAAARAVASANGRTFASEHLSEPVMITPLTDLVAGYHGAHPEKSLAEAEAAVKGYLRLPAHHDVRYHLVLDSPRPGFAVRNYLASGIPQADIIQSIDNPTNPKVPNAVFSLDGKKYWEQEGIQLGVAVVTTLLQIEGLPFGALVGWAVNLIEGQFGGTSQFGQLAQAIEALAKEIDQVYLALRDEIDKVGVENQVALTNSAKASIDTQELAFRTILSQGSSLQIQQQLAANVTSADFVQQIDALYLALTGPTGLLHNFAGLYGVSSATYYRNAEQFANMNGVFTLYASYQTRAIRLIVEGYHSLARPNPGLAQAFYDKYCFNLADEATQIPQPLDSDDVVYVRPTGLIFYRKVMPQDTYDDAQNKARVFREAGYTGWRVATRDDLYGLVQPHGADTHKARIDELKGHGFDFSTLNPDFPTWVGIDARSPHERAFNLDNPEDNSNGIMNTWDVNAQPYILVCNASEQPDAVLPALTELVGVKLRAEGNRVLATGTVQGNDGKRDSRGHYGGFQRDLDWTDLCSYATSDSLTLRVQNPPASGNHTTAPNYAPPVPLGAGFLTWYQPGTNVTVTATGRNPFGADMPAHVGTVTLTNTTASTATLQKLLLGPAGLLIDTPTASVPLSVIGFYSDGSSRYLAEGVTFTTSYTAARVRVVQRDNVLLLFDGDATAPDFTVTATAGNVTGTLNVTTAVP